MKNVVIALGYVGAGVVLTKVTEKISSVIKENKDSLREKRQKLNKFRVVLINKTGDKFTILVSAANREQAIERVDKYTEENNMVNWEISDIGRA